MADESSPTRTKAKMQVDQSSMNVLSEKKSRVIIRPKESLKSDGLESERRDTLADPDMYS